MIGTIRIMKNGILRVASLSEDGSWSIAPPLPPAEASEILPILNSISRSYRGPSDGPFGPGTISEATKFLRLYYDVLGISLETKKPNRPGTIY